MSAHPPPVATNFIRQIIESDIEQGKNQGRVATRFPPEPNGYLHIGHAKSICLNFGVAQQFGGTCNLRFDDTNPEKENPEFIESIRKDVEWLGFQWHELRYASSYFDQLYDFAVELIKGGKAYVDSLPAEQIRELRGTLKEPGKDSPYRTRSVEENLDLFARMKAGEFADGEHVVRAKIDMASGNINLRDPVIYRIRHITHHTTGDKWCIYPMYDFTHGISDAIEGITHSLCTLEFEDHRPLYDWILDNISIETHPQQIEFSRLELEYTLMSKRKLQALVEQGHVSAWDDPRMPTISGLRRRGFPAAAIREFCERIGITKKDAWIEMGVLEDCVRNELNDTAPRRMAVLDPVKVTITNLDSDHTEALTVANHPKDESFGQRTLTFGQSLFIEREDFAEIAPNKKFKRLTLGGEVRLRGAYVIRCDEVIKDEQGNITELLCHADLDTLGKNPEGRKVKGVIHWVAESGAVDAQVNLYDRLFAMPNPAQAETLEASLNPESLSVLSHAKLESSMADALPGEQFQFERMGYFCVDSENRAEGSPVTINRTVTLRDTWAKIEQKSG